MESVCHDGLIPGVLGQVGVASGEVCVGVLGMLLKRRPSIRSIARFAVAAAALAVLAEPVFADTLEVALTQAYQNNPSLNAQRAALRATDEGVPIALSGYRPRVTGTLTAGATGQEQT